ncbi:MAG TPA: hypothetical protein VGQ62_22360 [Chloroflexota bacterium]|jgi:hypothetical protein|nr:hypothetical protein [Chloroflexota bacterium]
MLVLEQKLSILRGGPGHTRRNPALDVLTGRVPDERLQSLQAVLLTSRNAVTAAQESTAKAEETLPADRQKAAHPSAMTLPVAAIRMAAVARSQRASPSPWLQTTTGEPRPRLRLVAPPPSRWSRVPWLGPVLARLMAERRPYKSTVRSPRPHLAS